MRTCLNIGLQDRVFIFRDRSRIEIDEAIEAEAQRELMEPLGKSGFRPRFLAHRGEGVHRLTVPIKDIESKLEYLPSRDIKPIHVILGERWKRSLHTSRQADGVVIQLMEVP